MSVAEVGGARWVGLESTHRLVGSVVWQGILMSRDSWRVSKGTGMAGGGARVGLRRVGDMPCRCFRTRVHQSGTQDR